MGRNDMTDTVNLRMLASKLRNEGKTSAPDDVNDVLNYAKSLGIQSWTQRMIDENAGHFAGMLAFHMADVGDGC